MDRSHLNQKDMKNCKFFASLFTKGVQMPIICTDTCLEMLSSLGDSSVDNVRSEIGPWAYLAQLRSFKPVKDSE